MKRSKPIPSRLRQPKRAELLQLYRTLRRHYGHRNWWPGETSFEIAIGAILTQNVSWSNVEKAIAQLKKERVLSPKGLHSIQTSKLAQLVRSTRYFNLKAERLKYFISFLMQSYRGSLRRMFKTPVPKLRKELLSVKGIGEETADAILLYAGNKPSFVIDAYTRRLLKRHRYIRGDEKYATLQRLFVDTLPRSLSLYNDFHAQIVEVGKDFCRPKDPQCELCPLKSFL